MSKALNNIDLTAAQCKEVAALLQRYLPNTEVWAYGSRVKFTAKPHSDLDMVAFAAKEQSQAVANLREAFEESYLPFRVDLFVWDEVPEGFRRNIEEARVVVQEKEKKECELPEGWQETTLGDVLTLQRGFDLPRKDRKIGQVPVIASTGAVGCHNENRVYGPGVVIGRSGSIGGAQFIAEDFWPLNTTLWVKDFKGNDVRYCYYLIKSIDLSNYNVGSGVPTLNRNHIHPHPVFLPPLQQQKVIAQILGSLDDKIELNRRMNETLEAMAQALFKSWFVDFDPVIDNALAAGNTIPDELKEKACLRRGFGRQAAIRQGLGDKRKSLPDDIRRLFPSKFAYTEEMGWVPKRWEIKNLDQIGVFKNGLALQKFPPIEGEEILPVVKIAQLRKGNTTGSDLFASRIADDFIINDGDFIFSWSGSLLAKFWVGGKGALNQHLFKVEGKEHPLWFVAGWVHQHMPEFCAIAKNKATTMGHIKKRTPLSGPVYRAKAKSIEKVGSLYCAITKQANICSAGIKSACRTPRYTVAETDIGGDWRRASRTNVGG